MIMYILYNIYRCMLVIICNLFNNIKIRYEVAFLQFVFMSNEYSNYKLKLIEFTSRKNALKIVFISLI